ncbi:anthranilate synthase component I [Caloramator sp. E03]|uniref:anthranilate synthase component I n=1 Tax=Caloramator sp. E03 TaxID=2576307 RepID=UPI001110410F|nr:anthranilate synthase component I [Caloramator sp. E03]QCX32823.1 anthranilate synthase component I [Caloramator sp. E03]
MVNLSEIEFKKYKSMKKVFPVYLTINADEITPISIYYSIKGSNKFILESVFSEKEIGRYSFIGAQPYMSIKSYGEEILICRGAEEIKSKGKVLDCIKKYIESDYESLGLDIPFTGGAVGYIGYDVIRQYEKIPNKNKDEIDVPEAFLMFYKTFICYDHFRHKMILVYNVFEDDEADLKAIIEKLNEIKKTIKENIETHELKDTNKEKEFESNFTKEEYCRIVEKAKEYIKQGEIFQVVLSQRMKFICNSDPFDVYRRLRSKNPSPYLFYIDFRDFQIAGSSPERLVSLKGRKVVTNPIAGTRARGRDSQEDENLKVELLKDEKEKSEHVMLVDLARNDIGRISEFNSVTVERFMEVDYYSHVMHIVSTVSGELKKGLTCFDALSSCLPVGTVSGAPKIRAMEIIDELENVRRGIYAGAVGYFSFSGDMDTCIAIRTIIFKENSAYIQAGAGIVFDSNPESEYMETLNKAMAMKEVI